VTQSRAAVTVPATSANLGPGFDAFGLALDLTNRFEAALAPQWTVEVVGQGAGTLLTDAGNRVAQAMQRVFSEVGQDSLAAEVRCENEIPTGRGLGSSSSAIVGGLLLGNRLTGETLSQERILDLAIEMEGHPDNVAAALLGALTVCWADAGRTQCARFSPCAGLAAVVAVPEAELSTTAARAMLPDTVPYADAAFNAGRSGLLGIALALGRAELLGPALEDRLHEQYRSSAIPDYAAVRAALLAAGADGVALSGAGPTLIALVAADDDDAAYTRACRVAEAAAEPLAGLGSRRQALALRVDRVGARLG